jgi:zinc protease
VTHLAGSRVSRWLVLVWVVAALPGAAPAAPRPAAPLGVRFALPNGVVVLVAERPALPIVVVQVAVGAGSVLDPPGQIGLSALTVRMMARGTPGRTGPEIDRAIEQVGGRLDAEGGRDWATLGVAVLRRDLALGLDLLADVLLHPTFPAEELDRAREEAAGDVQRSEDDPESVAGRAFRELAFPAHPYGRPIAGTEETLARLTREDIAAFYAAAYRPQATVVAVAGDVSAAEIRSALAARLGGWTSTAPAPAAPPLVALGTPAGTTVVRRRDLAQTTVLTGQATVTHGHPDHYPLVVAAHLLGGGSSSRLYLRLREEQGHAYNVWAEYAPGRYGGLLVVGFQSEARRVREALALVRTELRRLRETRVGSEELARAKAYLVGSFPLRIDTTAEVATLLLGVEQLGLGLDYPARYRRAIQAVTADDVRRAVRAHWRPERMSLAVVGDVDADSLDSSP